MPNEVARCKEAAAALKKCIKKTPCWKKGGKSMRECLRDDLETKTACDELRYSYFVCKRGLHDGRSRLRGIVGYER